MLQRRTVKKSPYKCLVNRVDDSAQFGIPVDKAVTQIVYVAAIRPQFTGPEILLDVGDEIHQPFPGNVVHDDMFARAEPNLRRHLDIKVLDALDWN